ncbi:MAG TPA: hypothetical protein VHQ20_02855 [Patescibacteria group bacterium]|jgi:hypothetical protein|nr:hypothetical protein [Patescibacteria group bacterium]
MIWEKVSFVICVAAMSVIFYSSFFRPFSKAKLVRNNRQPKRNDKFHAQKEQTYQFIQRLLGEEISVPVNIHPLEIANQKTEQAFSTDIVSTFQLVHDGVRELAKFRIVYAESGKVTYHTWSVEYASKDYSSDQVDDLLENIQELIYRWARQYDPNAEKFDRVGHLSTIRI